MFRKSSVRRGRKAKPSSFSAIFFSCVCVLFSSPRKPSNEVTWRLVFPRFWSTRRGRLFFTAVVCLFLFSVSSFFHFTTNRLSTGWFFFRCFIFFSGCFVVCLSLEFLSLLCQLGLKVVINHHEFGWLCKSHTLYKYSIWIYLCCAMFRCFFHFFWKISIRALRKVNIFLLKINKILLDKNNIDWKSIVLKIGSRYYQNFFGSHKKSHIHYGSKIFAQSTNHSTNFQALIGNLHMD